MATREQRKRGGVFYTPEAAARVLSRMALGPVLKGMDDARGVRVIDPACGDGALLEAAACEIARVAGVALTDVVARCVMGVDVDATAVRACRSRLESLTGGAVRARVRRGDSLVRWAGSDTGGWDVVIGNPPYLFGENRPRVEADRFALACGSWDASWLFLERALERSRPGATVAMVMPESVAMRTATAGVRRFVMERARRVDLVWLGSVFDAGIAPVAWVIRKGRARGGVVVRGWGLGRRGLVRREVPASFWEGVEGLGGRGGAAGLRRVAARSSPDGSVALDDVATIQIGEVEGKRSLRRLVTGERGAFPVLTGESVRGAGRQAVATHDLGHAPRKSAERYAAPKVLVVKTGKTLKVGVDLIGYPTLQSVYCLRVRESARRAGWTEQLLAAALEDGAVSERWIRPFTEGREVFPQITVTMLRRVRIVLPGAGVV